MDLAKYRNLFLEEATEHLAEMARALLELEKEPARGEAIDLVFRMAHSIKGMAGTLGYDAITELAHRLEDHMDGYRAAGRVEPGEGLGLLFRGLEGLERMVEAVRETGEPPAVAPASSSRSSDARRPPARKGPAAQKKPTGGRRGGGRAAALLRAAPGSPSPPPSVRVRTEILDRFLNSVGEVVLSSRQLRTASEGERAAGAAELAVGFDRMERVVGRAPATRALAPHRAAPARARRAPAPRPGAGAPDREARRGRALGRRARARPLRSSTASATRWSTWCATLSTTASSRRPSGAPRARPRRASSPWMRAGRRTRSASPCATTGRGIDLEAVRARAVESGALHADLAADLPPEEVLAFVFHPGLSTRHEVSDISGRGVGMDAVKSTIESLGGHVELASDRGRGAETTLVVPITAAVQRVLLLGLGEDTVAVPISKVERIVEIAASALERAGHECFALVDGEPLLVLDLAERLGLAPPPPSAALPVVLAEVRGQRVGVRIERLAGQQEIYVKPVPRLLASARALAGMTVLGDGTPVFVLDLNQVA